MKTAHNNYLDLRTIDEFPDGELLQDRVLVEPEPTTPIALIDSPNTKATKGTVVRIGKGGYDKKGRLIPFGTKPGDKVLFGAHAVSEVFLRDKKYLIMRESNILGVEE